MNYPNNTAIDIDALMLALAQQATSLPPDLQQRLTQISETFLADPTEGGPILRDLIRTHPPLENAYLEVLQQWDDTYANQHRAKSLSATFNTNQGFGFIFAHDILPSTDWVSAAQRLVTRSQQPSVNATPEWIRRGNTIVTMISGGAFLGVLLAQLPGALIGAVIAGIFGWYTSKPKAA